MITGIVGNLILPFERFCKQIGKNDLKYLGKSLNYAAYSQYIFVFLFLIKRLVADEHKTNMLILSTSISVQLLEQIHRWLGIDSKLHTADKWSSYTVSHRVLYFMMDVGSTVSIAANNDFIGGTDRSSMITNRSLSRQINWLERTCYQLLTRVYWLITGPLGFGIYACDQCTCLEFSYSMKAHDFIAR